MEMKTKILTALAAAALLIGGCAMEPSEADIKVALEKDIAKNAESIDSAGKMFGGAGKALTDAIGKPELHAVKKIGCVQAKDAPGFVCDIEIDMTSPLAGRGKDMATARFVKGPEGWVVVK
jgi:hypothetical protein